MSSEILGPQLHICPPRAGHHKLLQLETHLPLRAVKFGDEFYIALTLYAPAASSVSGRGLEAAVKR